MSKKELVVKSNQVIEASYRLTVIEQKVLLSAIAKIPKQVAVTDNEIYTVSISDLQNIGSHEKTAYRELKQAVERLYDRSINFVDGSVSKIRWVQRIDFNDSKSEIAIRFSKDILPYISNVKANFTQYLLSDVATMKSAYSFRLYELLAQYKSIGKRLISIDDLRLMLDIGKRYKTTGNLIAWVIEPSIHEINDLTNLIITVLPKKTGRKYTHLEFTIKQKPSKATAHHKQRDDTTADLFSINNLSDAQLARIARNKQFIVDYNHLISPQSNANNDTNEWVKVMVARLKTNPNDFNKRPISEYLN
jgi:plasmid replication initiation protein